MYQKIITTLFALLIFFAHLHCVLEHGLPHAATGDAAVVTTHHETSSSASSVPAEPEHCEGGCICKGATLAEHFVFSNDDCPAFGFQFAETASSIFTLVRAELVSERLAEIPISCGPLRALDRCAIMQLYLI